MALGRIGASTIPDYETGTTPEAIQCRIHYEQSRDALLRSYWWRFAASRKQIASSTTDPAFEWAYRYPLPSDFLALRSIYEENGTRRNNAVDSVAVEGEDILSDNGSPIQIRYTKRITDTGKFDPLFIDVLALRMATKLLPALARSGSGTLLGNLNEELRMLTKKVRAMDRQEQEKLGRCEQSTWLDSRYSKSGGRILSRMGS